MPAKIPLDRRADWRLICSIYQETNNDTVGALRVALLNLLSLSQSSHLLGNVFEWAKSIKSFSLRRTRLQPINLLRSGLPWIFIPYATGSNSLNLTPVVEEASRRGMLGGIVLGDTINPEKYLSFGPVATVSQVRSLVRTADWPTVLKRTRYAKTVLLEEFRRRDGAMAEAISKHFGIVHRAIVESEVMRIAFSRLFSQRRPSFLLSTSDFWPTEFQAFWQASTAGIHTGILQHGEFTDVVVWPTVGDTFLAWGDVYLEQLITRGADPQRVRVTGMPATDKSFRGGAPGRRAVASSSPTCLLFSHAHDRFEEPELFVQLADYLRDCFALAPSVRWKIKLHPAEDASFYVETGLANEKNVSILSRDVSLHDAIEQSDVCCTIRSTAGLQAMAMERPLIIIDLKSRLTRPLWWLDFGGGLSAKTPMDFGYWIDQLSDSKIQFGIVDRQRIFLEKSFANRGYAASAVVDFLAEATISRSPEQRSSCAELPI
jgi:hypothetical protein